MHYKTLLADLLTPVSAFQAVASDSERAFLLESVEGGEKIGRFSFIGMEPEDSFQGSFGLFRSNFPSLESPMPLLPPFTGGAVGLIRYSMISELEDLVSRHESSSPAVEMDFYSTVLAFDHLRHRIVIISREGQQKISEIEERLSRQLSRKNEARLPEMLPFSELESEGSEELQSNYSAEDFFGVVETAKEYIRAGDIFQVVLSQRFEKAYSKDPFLVYRALRFINPSPYMFFLKGPDRQIVGTSPEMLVRVQGNRLDYRPIAGTRRRGRNREEELMLEQELRRDHKERAEHLMLVDLGRNDLGRVSEFGSVQVTKLMQVEKYSHVMHLVSSLTGQLRGGLDRFDALASCFPAGTVTGAPKIRAMQIIDELEPEGRGVYAGAIGYVDYSGNLDTCIAIRTLEFEAGRAKLQAGAGIVADSLAEREHQECQNKARALMSALRLAERL